MSTSAETGQNSDEIIARDQDDTRITKIAVIDDDPDFRRAFCRTLSRENLKPFEMEPSDRLAEEIVQQSPPLVFLDLSLGKQDAVQVLDKLGARRYRGFIALMSGISQDTVDEVRSIGIRNRLRMLSSLPKPVSQSQLVRILTEAGMLRLESKRPVVKLDLRQMLKYGWAKIWYQPQFDLKTRSIRGLESIVHVEHPQHGTLAPSRFMPAFDADDRTHLAGYVMTQVAKDFASLGELGRDMSVGVNVSMDIVQRGSLLNMLRETWAARGNRPKLTLEVNEDSPVAQQADMRELALQLRLYGAELSMDHFGTGYSSFQSLQTMPFAELKLDKSYVTGAGDSDTLSAICSTSISLAKHFGLRTVADGIETGSDLKAAVAAGFDIGQGDHLCKTMAFEEMVKTLTQHSTAA